MIPYDVSRLADQERRSLRDHLDSPLATRATGTTHRRGYRISADSPPDAVVTVVSDEEVEVLDSATGLTTVQRAGQPVVNLRLHEMLEDIAAVRFLPSSIPRNGHALSISLSNTNLSQDVSYQLFGDHGPGTYAPPNHTLFAPKTSFNRQDYAFDSDGQLKHTLGDYADATTITSYPPMFTTKSNAGISCNNIALEWKHLNGNTLSQVEDKTIGEIATLQLPDSLILQEHSSSTRKLPASLDGLWIGPHCGGCIITPVSATSLGFASIKDAVGNDTTDGVTSLTSTTKANTNDVTASAAGLANTAAAGATFTVTFDSTNATQASSIVMVDPGSGYKANDTLTFAMAQFGGTTGFTFTTTYPRRSLRSTGGSAAGRYENTNIIFTTTEITHTTAGGSGAEVQVFFGLKDKDGNIKAEAVMTNAGINYSVGDTLTIAASKLGPDTASAVDLVLHIDRVTTKTQIPYATSIQINQSPTAVPSSVATSYFRHVVTGLTVKGAANDSKKQAATYTGVTPAHPGVILNSVVNQGGVQISTPVVNRATALGPLVFSVVVSGGLTTATITNCGYGATKKAGETFELQLTKAFFNTSSTFVPSDDTDPNKQVKPVTFNVVFEPDEAIGNPSADGLTDQTNHRHCRVATTPLFLRDYTWQASLKKVSDEVDYATLKCLTSTVTGGRVDQVNVDGVALAVGDRVLVKEFPTAASTHPYMQIVDEQAAAVTGHQPAHFNGIYTVTHAGTATNGMILRRDKEEQTLAFRRIVNIKEGSLHGSASFLNKRGIPTIKGTGYDASDKTAFNVYDRLVGDPRAASRNLSACVVHPTITTTTYIGPKEGDLVSLYRDSDSAASANALGLLVPLLTIGGDTAFSLVHNKNGVIRDDLLRILSPHVQERAAHMALSSVGAGVPAVSMFAGGGSSYAMQKLVIPSKLSGLPVQAEHRVWGKDHTGADMTSLSKTKLVASQNVRVYGGSTKTAAIVSARLRTSGTNLFNDRQMYVSTLSKVTTQRVAIHPYALKMALYKTVQLV